ncbi:MAG: hypothetical protein WB721_16855 [Pseudolabrys sp.]
MRRRDFLAGVTGALAMPLSARAQQTTTRTIGWFSLRSADTDTEKSILAAFREGLGQTGYVEGRNLRSNMVLPMANTTDCHFLRRTWCAGEWKCS